MSDKVKRYDLEYTGHAYSEHRDMVECEFGDWVEYEDYQSLETEVEQIQKLKERDYQLLNIIERDSLLNASELQIKAFIMTVKKELNQKP